MRRISIAVCDADAAYSRKLGEWIALEKGGQFSGCSFSAPESFLEFLETQKLDVVLLGNGFWKDSRIAGRVCEGMAKDEFQDIGHVCQEAAKKETFQDAEQVCQESINGKDSGKEPGGILWIYLHDAKAKESIPRLAGMVPAIEKYQAASEIVREIFSYCQEYRIGQQEILAARCEVTGIYSPGHSSWQTPFALTLAQALSRKERALYVNLKEWAGFDGWLQENYRRDLLDVMYLCLTGEGNISDCIGSAVYTLEGFDYIPPARDSICLGQISGRDYIRFIRLIVEKSGYDSIILDFGMMLPGFSELLEMCSKVYVLDGKDRLQEHSLEHFRQMMARRENQKLEGKLSYLSLPRMEAGNWQGEAKIQQWVWGELGDYVRGLVGDTEWNRLGNVY